MKKCIKRTVRDLIVIVTLSLGASLLVFIYHTGSNSYDSFERSLWLQSTEQQLKNQNEDYYNSLYDRYSRLHRDLNDYQYQANQRLTSLENRIKALEENVRNQGIVLNNTNTQINNEGLNNED